MADHSGDIVEIEKAQAALQGTTRNAGPVIISSRKELGNSWWVPLFTYSLDVLTIEFAIGLGYASRIAWLDIRRIELDPLIYNTFLAVGPVIAAVYAVLGLHPGYGLTRVERLQRRTLATLILFSTAISWDYIVNRHTWSRGVLLVALAVVLILGPLVQTLGRRFLRALKAWGKPVVVIGLNSTGQDLVRRLRRDWKLGLVPVAYVNDLPGEPTQTSLDGLPVLSDINQATRINRQVDTAIVVVPDDRRHLVSTLVDSLPFPNVVVIPDLSDVQSLWVTSRDLGGVLGLEMKKGLLLRRNRLIKRFNDVVIASLILLASLPVLIVASILIELADPGPLFYSQERRGLKGRSVHVWKLRTMYRGAEERLARYLAENPAAAEEWRLHFKLREDPRIIPYIGAFLRRSSIDEIPQLWNVLKGEMSLVGPRPLPDYHLAAFGAAFLALRQGVTPGLTGLWQVTMRSNGDIKVQESLDTYYIRNWSIWLDLDILLRTFGAVVSTRGAR